MEAQLRRKVLANSRPEFTFKVIDPAVAPDSGRYSSPRPVLVLAASLFAGILLSLLVLFVRSEFRNIN
jgi:uncharacterized protein involved in exopolysaccharide biosynthesis